MIHYHILNLLFKQICALKFRSSWPQFYLNTMNYIQINNWDLNENSDRLIVDNNFRFWWQIPLSSANKHNGLNRFAQYVLMPLANRIDGGWERSGPRPLHCSMTNRGIEIVQMKILKLLLHYICFLGDYVTPKFYSRNLNLIYELVDLYSSIVLGLSDLHFYKNTKVNILIPAIYRVSQKK